MLKVETGKEVGKITARGVQEGRGGSCLASLEDPPL